jgi:predicted amidohydrolase
MEVPLKVALAQYASGRDPAEIVAEARAAAAEIVVFPEMYSNGYARFDPDDAVAGARWCAAAENLGGAFVGLADRPRRPLRSAPSQGAYLRL